MRAIRSLAANWPALAVGLAPLAVFWPLLFTGRVLFWGLPLLQFYPWRWLALQQMRAGQFPLWNPYLGAGAPLLANYQTGALYPPNWLSLMLPLDYSLGLIAVLHVAAAGLGMVWFTRALGLRPLGQAVAGLAFALSGYLVARLWFLSIIAAAAWLPWLLWAVERMGARPAAGPGGRLRWLLPRGGGFLALAGLMAMQLLAGHAQTTFYSLLLAGGWAAWRGWQRGAAREALRQVALCGMALAFALCLAAAQLLPTAELLRQSPRADAADYDFVVTYSYWPWRLITLLAPDAFGNPAYGNYWGYGNYWEDAAYLGVLPLGLAGLAVVEWARGRRRAAAGSDSAGWQTLRPAVPLLAGFALFALLLALGRNTPLFPFFYRYVPGFDLFQAPARFMIWFVWALALLAGAGTEVWARPEGAWRAWSGRGVAAGLGMALAGAGAAWAAAQAGLGRGQPVFDTMPQAVTAAGLLAAGSFGLALLQPSAAGAGGRWTRPRWTALVVAFAAADLFLAGRALNPAVDPALYREPTASGAFLRAWLGGKRLYQFDQDEYAMRFGRFFRFDTFGPPDVEHWRAAREAQLPNLALLEGIASANNFDPLLPARYQNYLDALQAAEPERAQALLRALGVQGVVSAAPVPGMAAVYQGDGFGVYAVPGAAERARIAYYLQGAGSPEESLEHIQHERFDPGGMAVIETAPGARPFGKYSALCRASVFDGLARRVTLANIGPVVISGAARCQYYADAALRSVNRSLEALGSAALAAGFGSAGGSAEDVLGPFAAAREAAPGQPALLTESPTHIRIAAFMEFSGYLILADTYYPGWRATVDGKPADLVPADHAFRGVFLPAGRHLVEFRYEPQSVRAGALLSGLAWLAFAALTGLRLARARAAPAA